MIYYIIEEKIFYFRVKKQENLERQEMSREQEIK